MGYNWLAAGLKDNRYCHQSYQLLSSYAIVGSIDTVVSLLLYGDIYTP